MSGFVPGKFDWPSLSPFEEGFFVGLLVGEGHFGGDGRQPQITLRMHVRHGEIFRWLTERFPQAKLYGPYNHDGRTYFQWMVRGSYLRGVIVPLLYAHLDFLDPHVRGRFLAMCERYHIPLPQTMVGSGQPIPAP